MSAVERSYASRAEIGQREIQISGGQIKSGRQRRVVELINAVDVKNIYRFGEKFQSESFGNRHKTGIS